MTVWESSHTQISFSQDFRTIEEVSHWLCVSFPMIVRMCLFVCSGEEKWGCLTVSMICILWWAVHSVNKLAGLCCVLFSLFVWMCLYFLSCWSPHWHSVCLYACFPWEPGGLPFPPPPFSEFTTFSVFTFFSSCFAPSLSHAGSFASSSTLTSTPSPTFMCSLLSVPCMALCCCHNTRGQAMRSLTTGDLQAWLNPNHPHHHPTLSKLAG